MIEVQVFRTTGAHTIIHEACTVHLQGTPVPPGRFVCIDSEYVFVSCAGIYSKCKCMSV